MATLYYPRRTTQIEPLDGEQFSSEEIKSYVGSVAMVW